MSAPSYSPALSRLGLAPDEMEALRSQGFVVSEMRRGEPVYKLRFRIGARQRVRYLGKDNRLAEEVKAGLHDLQRGRSDQRELAVLARAASRQLAEAKRIMTPLLEEDGFHFHGQAIRQRRTPRFLKRVC